MVSDFVRQISSPFTTRLALVFASWADENIIRIETVQDAFVASDQRIFFLFDFEQTSQQLLKVPKAPRSALGTFRESTGTAQRPHSTTRLFSEVSSIDPGEILTSIYKRNLREEKYVENISNAARTLSLPSPAKATVKPI